MKTETKSHLTLSPRQCRATLGYLAAVFAAALVATVVLLVQGGTL